jgi:diacylglycerol kinase (ATP)
MKEAHPVITNPLLEEILRPQRIVFIVNPQSGTRMQARIRESLDQYLNHRKFVYSIWYTEYPGHATQLAEKAVKEGFEIVAAVGGDGSINEVASGLLHSDVALGIVPAGSGNGLAMHLGYGRKIEEAIKKLNSADVRLMDCGMLNGRPFVNMAGIGFDGLVSNLMRGQTKRGLIPYFIKSVKAGLEYTSKPCVLKINGLEIKENCFAVTVANGPMFGYNVSIAPDARMDDGLFSVVILKDAPRWQYFAAMHSALTGRIFRENFVDHYSTDKLIIESGGENFIHFDGEGIKHTGDLVFTMIPQSLKVLVPRNAPYTAS